jgi:outer membrane receptor protein involved in Fe transport
VTRCPHTHLPIIPMKTRCLALLAMLAPPALLAQVAPTAAQPAPEEAVVLSPFVVNTTADTDGYRATSTLAGSRIKTDLKDVAASVTVLTAEFLDDLGAKDVASAMAFVSGAENDSTYHQESVAALGSANGYVGGDFGDNNTRSGEIRVRGLGRASSVVNFIEVLGSTDRYNTDRVEFLRGPNSILFGLAEPAGLVNSSTKVAGLRRNATKVENKLDHFGSNRVMLDHNLVLVRGKLAVRGVALYDDARYSIDTAFQRDKRGFATATYQPFKGTTIRAYAEQTQSVGRRPNYRTVQDNVSEWLKAYNTYAPQMTAGQIAQAFYWDPTVPNADGLAPVTTLTLANGTTANLGLIRRPLDGGGSPNQTLLIYSGNGNWTNLMDNLITVGSNRTITNTAVTPASARSAFMRSGAARENNPAFRADPQVTDTGIFPYDRVEIAALPGNRRTENDRKLNLTIDQRITDDLYVSATVQRETRNSSQYFASITQTNEIQIDINQKLPDGRTNPNFLRPFVFGRNIGEYGDTTYTNYLVQANYDFDFAKKTTRLGWLGSHRVTGVYTHAKQDRFLTRFNDQIDSDLPGALTAAAVPITNAGRWAHQLWYVGDAVKVGDTALRFTGFPDTLTAAADRSYDYRFYNNLATPPAWQTAAQKMHVGKVNIAGASWTVARNSSVGTSLQSFFWKGRIVTLAGWRRDTVKQFLGIVQPPASFAFPTYPGRDRGDFQATGTNFKNQADTTTQSVVFKVTEKVRLLANRSENFAATNPRLDNLYRSIAPASGNTDEAGFGVALFNNKLDVKVTTFKSRQQGTTNNTGVASLRIAAFEDNLYNALSNAGRQAEWSTLSSGGGTTTERYTTPNNAASTQDTVSKGAAVEVYFRPNRNWDFVASFDKLENVVTRVGHEIGDFLAARAPYYKKYFTEGLRVDGTNNTTVSSSTPLTNQFVSAIAANWVNEVLSEGTSNRGISPYTAKLVGRYSFSEGRLKGLGIGTNLRWESGKVIGYGQKTAAFNFGGLENYAGPASDLSKEFKSDTVIAGGMVLNYSRKILNDRVRWKIQCNAQNLFSKTGLRAVAANSDGSPVWAVSPPRTYELANSFEF